jgi:hypothetical protein
MMQGAEPGRFSYYECNGFILQYMNGKQHMPASNDNKHEQPDREEFVQLDFPIEVERIPPRLVPNQYSLAPEDDGYLEGGGFFYENCREIFLGRSGYGPLRIAWDTNILIDYAEFGDLIWGPDDDNEYEFDPPVQETRYRQELVALYKLVQLWMMRDIRVRAPRRQINDAQRELSESQWEIRATQLHHFLAAVQCTLLDKESFESAAPFPPLPEGSTSDEWDCSLVSEAVATGCHVFLTRDDGLRRRLSQVARESFLAIMSPFTLVKALGNAGELGWGGEGYVMPDNHKWLHFMKATKHGEAWSPDR